MCVMPNSPSSYMAPIMLCSNLPLSHIVLPLPVPTLVASFFPPPVVLPFAFMSQICLYTHSLISSSISVYTSPSFLMNPFYLHVLHLESECALKCTTCLYESGWFYLKQRSPNTIYFSCKCHHFILYGQIKCHGVYAPHFLYLVSCWRTPRLTDFSSRQNSSHLITKMRLWRTCIFQETVTNEEDDA